MRAVAVALTLSVVLAGGARALMPDERLVDPALEARARAVGAELRCLVCQNQSIDDSDAALARDLRRLVRQRIAAGDDDRAVIDYVVARYGDFVRLRPPLKAATYALWFGPTAIVLAGAALLIHQMRRRRRSDAVALSGDERARLARILADED